ncbi:MAG: site-2 protease family protein [Bacilli bacterium]|nr:site-2 protease family protein [Bacilli bacterium]
MQFWQTLLNILIFLLGLSFVVCLHEAGHLAVAKICNVYCFEYSIGFGPVLFKHKFKHKRKVKEGEEVFQADENGQTLPRPEYEEGETQFSIRALPLGGYVAMAGEDGNLTEDGKVIPPERTLPGINHFKQICIMLAGITMNFILALVLFFFSGLAPQTRNIVSTNAVTVASESDPSYKAGLRTGDKILYLYQTYDNLTKVDDKTTGHSMTYPCAADQVELTAYQQSNRSDGALTSYNDFTNTSVSYAAQDIFYNYSYSKLFDLEAYDKKYSTNYCDYIAGPDSTRTFHITYKRGDAEAVTTVTEKIATKAVEKDQITYYQFGYLGISVMTESFSYNFGEAISYSFRSFGQLFTGLYTTLGSIFTPEGWKNVGGIISVYNMSAQGVQSGSLSYFLLLWGYISLNLGCFNLLPFPGLDGWQTLMALIETVSRRKVPNKIKSIANGVGMLILFALAAVLVIKDILMMM